MYINPLLSNPFTWLTDKIQDVWNNFVDLFTSNSEFLNNFIEVALYATMVASMIILATMIYLKPRRHLDRSFLLRELGLSTVISAIFVFRVFGTYSQLWYLLGFVFLLLSAPYIIFALIDEHRLSKQEIEAAIKEEDC